MRWTRLAVLLVAIAGCRGNGCRDKPASPPKPAAQAAAEPGPEVRARVLELEAKKRLIEVARKKEQEERYQVWVYDLSPYGTAKGTWESQEMDGSHVVREAERAESGDGKASVTRDGELLGSVYMQGGVTYTQVGERCRAAKGTWVDALRTLPSLVRLSNVPVIVYGVLGDGVPDSASKPIAKGKPPSSLAHAGLAFDYKHPTSLYDVRVKGTVWRDDNDRPVRSQGQLKLRPLYGDEKPSTASWSFSIEPAKRVVVKLPEPCQETAKRVAMIQALPQLDGARPITMNNPASLIYQAPGTVNDALALYESYFKPKGWKIDRQTQGGHTMTYVFRNRDDRITAMATQKNDQVAVVVW